MPKNEKGANSPKTVRPNSNPKSKIDFLVF
jgi:hypothetical protein